MKYQYDRDLYLKSIFDGDTVYFETAFPIKGETIQLLYPIEEIIAVTNFGLDLIYEKGREKVNAFCAVSRSYIFRKNHLL